MKRRHLPRLWLMTDERIADLGGAVAALPRGSGIVFRHYATSADERRRLFRAVRAMARRHGLCLILAGPPMQAYAWGADGAHHRSPLASRGLRTVAVHNPQERALARRVGADLLFVSPVFATRSHADAVALGAVRLGLLVGPDRRRTVALGGMTAIRMRRLNALRLHGWAAIDGLTPQLDQKRIAVPR